MSWSPKPEQLQETKPTTPTVREKPEWPKKNYYDKSGMLLVNQSGLELIQHFEGCYLKAYQDSVGVWTIAWGRIVFPNGRKVRAGDTCTQLEADEWLLQDIWGEGSKYVRALLDDPIEGELSANQFSALAGFTYNRGVGRFRDYLAPFLNKRDFTGAMDSLVRVNWAGADRKYLLGLDRRRWAERFLFEGKPWEQFKSIEYFKAFRDRGYRA